MARSFIRLPALALTGILCGLASTASAAPASQPVALEIDDFSYLDTSAEPTDQASAHQIRLQAFTAGLRRDVEADDRYRLVPSSCAPPCDGTVTPDRLRAAAQAGTNILVVGGIHKMSTLVQWAKVSAIDVGARRVLFEKLYTFRGDNDEAWRRAETFVSQDIRDKLAGSAPASQVTGREPTRLAVFAFELEDTSAAANSTGETVNDAAELTKATEAVRQMLAQSSRYRVIDVSGASADAAKTNSLHDCDGCDAGIALALGADQSLVGVIRRVSRTEYTVRFHVRDTRTGTVVANADSGLRMGANYSWSRGAVRLIGDRLLEAPSQQ